MRRKAGFLCVTLGLLLLIIAVGLLGYNRWDNWRAGQEVAAVQEALEEAKAERQSEADDAGQNTENGGSDDADEAEVYARSAEMETVEIDGYAYIGTLSIPAFGLELPVMSEWSYSGLKISPGRYSGSVWTNDMVICGHNYTRHFGNLKNLEEGDTVIFTDVDGNVFYYQVKEVLILAPTDVEKMTGKASGDWDLTLYTCTLGGQTRVTVRCSRTADELETE